MEFELDGSLKEWVKDKPLSILQLDPADRAVLRIADERDAIQKKTFTKWVNKHLKKTYTCLHVCVLVNNQPCCSPTASRHVGDLFVDLRDGHNLISLLEVLSGEHLPRERGRMRFHMLQNVQMALDFLRYKKIKLVNIRAEDIVDGNPKLTLGLIWTIILHFQRWRRKISDIVVGQEPNVTAREALLRWARRSTARYPGVRVTDFTGSWRDGLAFSALIHRNRPDLVDWRGARASQPRERLDRVFHVAEREYGVTRLLDPEDVDTPEPDEKSLITYISSLYDVFPEPPSIHPLYDAEAQRRSAEYRELANSLHMWIREKMSLMQDRSFPPTLIEMKKLAADSTKFKNEEVPPRYRDKQRLAYIFRDLQKYFEAVGEVDMEPELHIELVEKNWNRLIMLHQEREQAIIDEIKRLERLQRLAEKVHREMKSTDNRLEELERRVEDEARRLDRLHPLEAKHAVDLLEQDIRNTEIQIQNIFTDVHSLTEGRYSQAAELQKRVQKLHQRWVALRSLLHKRLVQPLSAVSFPVEERVVTKHRTTVHETRLVETNPHFRALHDCIDWCKAKLKQLQEAHYGSDLPSVQTELEHHQREHKNIEQFQPKVERCVQAKNNFHGEELTLYSQHLGVLQKHYTELLSASSKRLTDLDTFHDFVQSATAELVWLNSKEETEVTRDWSDKNLNVQAIEQYYESLMSDLEKREIQFSAVQDRGEALILEHHPASKTIEAYMSAMQSQWAWLLQLTVCLEVHLKHATRSQQFFREVQQAEQRISKRDESLNSLYSQSEFSLDEGERLLKGMQELREELDGYGEQVQRLVEQAKEIVPLRQRRQPVNRPFQVTCVCSYKQVNMTIEKGEQCTLYDNSGRVKWRVKNKQGVEAPVPGACFTLPPADKDAVDAADRLRRLHEQSVSLWHQKQLRLRQNMIFATIKVVKGWDLSQFLAMDQDQRTAIRKALNEDAAKLLSEGDPADPQLRRLRREMAEVNKLFDDLEKRARAEEESKNAGRIFNDQASALQQALDEAERSLNTRIGSPLPRDLDSLEHLVLQHKNYEQKFQRLAPDIEQAQQTFRGITLKTPAMRNRLDNVTQKWSQIWNVSNLYIERLKCVEIVLTGLEENTAAISELEVKLASFDELPSDVKSLQNVLEELMVLQNAISQQQIAMDQLNEDAHNARRLVEKSRPNHRGPHTDMDRLDAEVNRLNARWTNICGQLVDRIRSAESAYGLAQQYDPAYRNETDFLEESYTKLDTEDPKNLLTKVVERSTAIEAVNVTGGRLIREGKIYEQRLRAFKEQLEDICPSLDASVKKPRRDNTDLVTVDKVARQLDTLNNRYSALVNLLQDRINQQDSEKVALQRSETPPAGTTIPVANERVPVVDTKGGQVVKGQDGFVNSRRPDATDSVDLGPVDQGNGVLEEPIEETNQPDSTSVTSVTETVTAYQTITTKTFELMPGYELVNGTEVREIGTGSVVKIEEAKERGIVREHSETKEFSTRSVKMAFEEALERGLVDRETGTFKDPSTGVAIPIKEAIETGVLDLSTMDSDTMAEISSKQSDGPLTADRVEIKIKTLAGSIEPERTKLPSIGNGQEVDSSPEPAVAAVASSVPGSTKQDTPVARTKEQTTRTAEAVKPDSGRESVVAKGQANGSASVSLTEAAKLGLTAVIAAPVLAGKAVIDAIEKRKDGREPETLGSATVQTGSQNGGLVRTEVDEVRKEQKEAPKPEIDATRKDRNVEIDESVKTVQDELGTIDKPKDGQIPEPEVKGRSLEEPKKSSKSKGDDTKQIPEEEVDKAEKVAKDEPLQRNVEEPRKREEEAPGKFEKEDETKDKSEKADTEEPEKRKYEEPKDSQKVVESPEIEERLDDIESDRSELDSAIEKHEIEEPEGKEKREIEQRAKQEALLAKEEELDSAETTEKMDEEENTKSEIVQELGEKLHEEKAKMTDKQEKGEFDATKPETVKTPEETGETKVEVVKKAEESEVVAEKDEETKSEVVKRAEESEKPVVAEKETKVAEEHLEVTKKLVDEKPDAPKSETVAEEVKIDGSNGEVVKEVKKLEANKAQDEKKDEVTGKQDQEKSDLSKSVVAKAVEETKTDDSKSEVIEKEDQEKPHEEKELEKADASRPETIRTEGESKLDESKAEAVKLHEQEKPEAVKETEETKAGELKSNVTEKETIKTREETKFDESKLDGAEKELQEKPDAPKADAAKTQDIDESKAGNVEKEEPVVRPVASTTEAGEPRAELKSGESRPEVVKSGEQDVPKSEDSKSDASKPDIMKPDQPKADASKPDEPKSDALKPDTPKLDASKPDEPRLDALKPDTPKLDAPKSDEPRLDTSKPEEPKSDASTLDATKPDEPKIDGSKPDESRAEASKADEPKPDSSRPEEPKPVASKPDEPKSDAPKADEPQPDASRADEPKRDTSKPDELEPDSSRPEEPKAVVSKSDEPKSDASKADEPKSAASKPDEPKSDASKVVEPKRDTAKPDELEPDTSRPDELEPDTSRPDESKSVASKPDEPKSDASTANDPKSDAPKANELKSDESTSDKAKPGVPALDKSKPDSSQPDASAPEAVTAHAETKSAELESEATETKEKQKLDASMPETTQQPAGTKPESTEDVHKKNLEPAEELPTEKVQQAKPDTGKSKDEPVQESKPEAAKEEMEQQQRASTKMADKDAVQQATETIERDKMEQLDKTTIPATDASRRFIEEESKRPLDERIEVPKHEKPEGGSREDTLYKADQEKENKEEEGKDSEASLARVAPEDISEKGAEQTKEPVRPDEYDHEVTRGGGDKSFEEFKEVEKDDEDEKRLMIEVSNEGEKDDEDEKRLMIEVSNEGEKDDEDEKRLMIEVSSELTSRDVANLGAYDLEKEKFVDPETREVTSFSDFVLNLGVFDPDAVKVKDLSSKTESYVSLREAIGRPLVDRNLGYMVDPKTGKKIPFFEAVSLGLIVQEPMDEVDEEDLDRSPVSVDLQAAVDSGICDPSTCLVRDPETGQTFTLSKAVEEGLINPESINVRDPKTDELVPLAEALESGEPMDLGSAFSKGLLAPDTRKPIALEAAIRQGLYDERTGLIEDTLTKRPVDIEESIDRGIIDPEISECKDSKAGALVPLKDAIGRSLVEVKTGRLRDTRTGELLPLNVALDRGLIVTAPFVLSLIDAIVREYYSPRTRLVINPVTGEATSVRDALLSGYVDGRTTMIKDDLKERVLSLNEADDIGLVDLDRGTFTYPHETTLDVAFQKGYILSTVKPWSLQEALAHQTYDPRRGTFDIDGGNYTLEEALESGLIGGDSPSIKDPRSGDVISVGEAVKQGLVDPKTGTALDPSGDAQLPFTEALDRGLIVPAKRKISLPEAVFKGLYDPRTGRFTVPETKEKLSTERAIRVGVIDASSAIVRNADGQAITFNEAIKDRLVDPKSGTVVNESGRPIDFREALERGVLVEARRPMTFSEAISKGLLDERTGRFLDPQAGTYLTLSEAISRNLIDADSVTVKDGRSGFRERITLTEAVRTGFVDGATGRGKDFTSLREAYDSGLIVDNRAAVSLQRAIHQGLYDEKSGRIVDPGTGRSVTLHEAMRKCLVSPTLPCYWDKRAGRLLSLAETCRAGVIDRRAGTFKEPGASVPVPLTTALQLDLIVDIESAGFGLYETILMNMYDPTTGKFTHPSTNERLTLADACRVDMINPIASIVKDTSSNRYVPLTEAIGRGLVDDTRGTYKVAGTGESIDLQQARTMGYVVPSKLPLNLEEAVKSGLYRPESGSFVDPTTNDSHDLIDALKIGLLDPETTALKDPTTGQTKSLVTAIEDGTIDPSTGRILDPKTRQGYSVDVALERGLLVTVDKPLTPRSPRTSGAEPLAQLERRPLIRDYTIEEAIRLELLDAVYTVTKDPRTGAYVGIGKAIEAGLLDPRATGSIEVRQNKPVRQRLRFGQHDVFLSQPLTLDQAIETGYLHPTTGTVTDPRTGERTSLKNAIGLGLIDPDSALVKDTKKKRLVNLSDAMREGLIDPEKGTVLNTETSRVYTLTEALGFGPESELVVTMRNGLGLIEALEYGYYEPSSGTFHDPFAITSPEYRRPITMREAIQSGSINVGTAIAKDAATGKLVSMSEAIDRELIDPVRGRFLEEAPDKSLDLITALERGFILNREAWGHPAVAGLELLRHISSDQALKLKDKLDSLERQFNDLVTQKHNEDSLPLVQLFHENHNRLMEWIQAAKSTFQSAELREEEIIRLEMEISEYRPILDKINAIGPQLYQLSPGEAAATIEGLVARDNRRFNAIAEQIHRKAERIQLSKQRSLEVIEDIDDLLDWFREADNQLREIEPPSSEPEIIRVQLKERRALNDDVSSQKGRVRDVISTAKKVIREIAQQEDTTTIREKMEDLRETMEIVSALLADRMGAIELALPLAEHFQDTHIGLVTWLEEAEQQVAMLPMPALRPDMIVAQQDKNELLMQRVNEHKPLVEKLNKTGEALVKLCNDEDGMKIQDSLEADTARYAALRAELRSRQQSLEQALQESSQFSDKLEGMLRALSSTAEQVNGIEPVSAHPSRLRDQMEENAALMDDLAQRSEAYAAVKRAADDVISKAGNRADPAVKDITRKLEKLNKLWADVQRATTDRGHTLDDTLQTAEKFWSELNGVMATLRELQDALACQAPPAAQPSAIQQQQVALQEIRQEIDQTKPDVDQVRASGHELMDLCGEPDKPEVRKHIEDLDQAWDNVTTLYAKREENLIDAMEKAMEFHETLQNLLEFLQQAEDSFTRMGPLGSDIDEVKKQMKQLADFKAEVDPHMVKVEALNRQAAELTVRTSSEQAAAIKEPLGAVNRRWNILLRGVVERQRLLENALLRLGQFQHALDGLLVWIEKTDATLDSLKPVAGDPQVIEVELAKLKVLVNDIQAHRTSVDTLNDAGRQLIEDADGTAEASTTSEKLGTLNRRWRDLLQRAADRQRGLEDALKEAQTFTAEIQDLLFWLGDVDNTITASKPVGGLPETASEQLDRFSEVYNELEQNRPKMETVLQQGQEYLKRAETNNAGWLNHNLRTLKQRWENVSARASDKKIKLEIALKEATEFHEALQEFVDWLTDAEKTLTNLRPASRVMETILTQIEEHKAFQKEVGVHRETMLNLDKKGTHLKYFSQKQDVILIKNLLISVQHRWERVVSKSAERTRALDHGYKEAREFHDAWSNLMNWLDETEKTLDEVAADGLGGNDPERIKSRLNKHREIQKALSAKQGTYDSTMKTGKALKDRAPGSDEAAVAEQLNELKNKWTTVCGKCVDRQRKLEEALLFSGQFKDAIQALLEWLTKSERQLSNAGPLHGDLDTVTNLVDQHRTFERDLESRISQMESVNKTGHELLAKASNEDLSAIDSQLSELSDLWDLVKKLSSEKSLHLEQALREAERLHKAVHHLLEWLSDAEMKLRFAGQLPEDEQESRHQLIEHEKFLRDLCEKEVEKDDTLDLAHSILAKAHPDGAVVIKHWITIIQSRWEEVATWAQQRNQRLENHMRGLQDLDNLLEELLAWLEGLENTLNALEAEPLPDDRATLEMLIADHREFMENTSQRQNEVDRVCKARQLKPARDMRKLSKAKSPASARSSPGRERTPDLSLPHIGPRFPPKGSKGSEPEFRSPRVKTLWDRWRHVWMLAWERQRRLQDKYNYIQEVDRVANFSWEDWRKRFLKFMNHKKSRLTDLFRKMDKNNDGLIPREDFIHGIMNTKFETSRLEMGAVADLFDRHGEGLIDWKEFIAALRPDWEERRTYNDTDKIHDEVKRLVMLCTCRQKFRVFQVGEGKYRFGDSQKLRLVRILRSTVMVRVGGGWVALDEFLLKNDPCRAKGRTNIELREQFILADGVSQTMTAFRSKPSPTATMQRAHFGSPGTGPITKVRERSARSVPMGQPRASRSSLNAGTPDSLSDNESSFRVGTARKTSTPHRSAITPGGSRPSSRPASRPASRPTSRPGSRPASRQGSKPSSRYGSTQSLDSTDDSSNPSRIPRRTSLATAGTTPTSSRHNSVSGKRLASTPVNGSSSRPRTPTGLISPASGTSQRFSTIHRASSIPILTGVGTPTSRSRIPVYVGADIKSPQSTTSNISTRSTQSNHSTVSTDSTGSSPMCANSATNIPSAVKQARTQTPSSGASTPLPHSLKLSRKPTGASDATSTSSTPTGNRRGKPTPIDQRAPFRL